MLCKLHLKLRSKCINPFLTPETELLVLLIRDSLLQLTLETRSYDQKVFMKTMSNQTYIYMFSNMSKYIFLKILHCT